MPEKEQPQVLARYSELLGDSQQAEQSYLSMLMNNSEDLSLLQTIAGFYVGRSNQTATAMKYLDQIITNGQPKDASQRVDAVVWARRVKAQLLKGNGDFDSLQQALKILQANAVDGKYLPEDAALIAGMLADAPRPNHASKPCGCSSNCKASMPFRRSIRCCSRSSTKERANGPRPASRC